MLLVECVSHRYGYGIEVSPDHARFGESGESPPEHIEIRYICEGELSNRFCFVVNFSAAHGLREGGTKDLPDEYPVWLNELTPVCEKC